LDVGALSKPSPSLFGPLNWPSCFRHLSFIDQQESKKFYKIIFLADSYSLGFLFYFSVSTGPRLCSRTVAQDPLFLKCQPGSGQISLAYYNHAPTTCRPTLDHLDLLVCYFIFCLVIKNNSLKKRRLALKEISSQANNATSEIGFSRVWPYLVDQCILTIQL
jgi:hypothetical protein